MPGPVFMEIIPNIGYIFRQPDVYQAEMFSKAGDFRKNLQTEIALPEKTVYNVNIFGIMSTALQYTDVWASCSQVSRGACMIRLKDVEMEYENGTKAIRGITLTIEDGEFVFLVGPSGSGKSTIIKLLTGEVEPCAGRIMINGFSVSNISNRQIPLMRRTLGVIFQDFRLIEKKTVYDNLDFVMRAVGAAPKEIKKRIPYVLELVGLGGKADRYPTELSGGEQQRVAIARALVNNPNTIIADEPTGNLDPDRSLELMNLLVKINELGTTVVVVTHEKDLVDRFGKRVITIDSGHVINDSVGGYVGGHIHG